MKPSKEGMLVRVGGYLNRVTVDYVRSKELRLKTG